ncbi:hypothetical protein TSAR_000149 [Trichomalopsis sarcophagae]|uniref:Uncharacterized protein n=1 Tax=Trichomalopsis sarcophagae TaxID=543379 RepID=A0A232EL06_9HYME|nr:hypothetical protein TSAR_000149 [Trichomalopsis sarcophagae]
MHIPLEAPERECGTFGHHCRNQVHML